MQNDWGWRDPNKELKEFNEIKDIKDSVRFVKLFNIFNIFNFITTLCSTGYIFVTRPMKTYGTYKTYGSL